MYKNGTCMNRSVEANFESITVPGSLSLRPTRSLGCGFLHRPPGPDAAAGVPNWCSSREGRAANHIDTELVSLASASDRNALFLFFSSHRVQKQRAAQKIEALRFQTRETHGRWALRRSYRYCDRAGRRNCSLGTSARRREMPLEGIPSSLGSC